MSAIIISVALFFVLGLIVIETEGLLKGLSELLTLLYVIVLIGISVFLIYTVFKCLCCIAVM